MNVLLHATYLKAFHHVVSQSFSSFSKGMEPLHCCSGRFPLYLVMNRFAKFPSQISVKGLIWLLGRAHYRNLVLEPKHNIFMSHSGAQKDFTHQLSLDLQGGGHFPFFDQWSDCLPKGDSFAKLILEAAKQCNMAVVILSPEYMTSKWAMIELNAFYMAQSSTRPELILFPAFYKLQPEDLKDESKLQAWEEKWEEHSKKDVSDRIDIKSWRRAVEKLRGINGLRFSDFGNSEVSYRARLVEEVCNKLSPCLGYDLSGIRGCDRLCEILEGMFEPTTNGNAQGVQILGLYGMGGMGKTTMCKALCNHFQHRFQGRVCHVELGPPEKHLDLQKKVLKKLTNLGDRALQGISDSDQAQLQLQSRMGGQDVFLAVDNVEDVESSREQARGFLKCTFSADSKLLVTGRSSIVVRNVLQQDDGIYCKPIPSVDATEASSIFLDKAAPGKPISSLETEEKYVVEECAKQACFSGKYHPLALRALASYYNDVDAQNPLRWQNYLNDSHKLRPCQESESGTIFQILGLRFGTFSKATKLLFLDVALFISKRPFILCLWPSRIPTIQWLSAMHREEPFTIRRKLKELERMTYLEECGEDFDDITVHDLYWEYAKWYVTQSSEEDADNATWIYFGCDYTRVPTLLEKGRAGKCWESLSRIYLCHLWNVNILPLYSHAWVNVVMLHLECCRDLASLDLKGMNCLQHLAIVECRRLKELEVSVEEKCLPRLRYLILNMNFRLKSIPEIWRCTELVSMDVWTCPKLLLFTVDIRGHCPKLEYLQINGSYEMQPPYYSRSPSNLQVVDIGQSMSKPIESVQQKGLNHASSSKSKLDVTLDPNKACPKKKQARLQRHVVEHGSNLNTLYLSMLALKNSQILETLTALERLTLTDVQLVDEGILRLDGCTHLRNLVLEGGNVHTIKGIGELLTLETLWLQDMKSLQHLPNLMKLRNLVTFEIIGCDNLKGYFLKLTI